MVIQITLSRGHVKPRSSTGIRFRADSENLVGQRNEAILHGLSSFCDQLELNTGISSTVLICIEYAFVKVQCVLTKGMRWSIDDIVLRQHEVRITLEERIPFLEYFDRDHVLNCESLGHRLM